MKRNRFIIIGENYSITLINTVRHKVSSANEYGTPNDTIHTVLGFC